MRYQPPARWNWERLGAALVYAALMVLWFVGVLYATGP